MSWLTDSLDEPLTGAPRPQTPTQSRSIPPSPAPSLSKPKAPPRYVFQDGQWIDTQAETSPSSNWLAESYAQPVTRPSPRPAGGRSEPRSFGSRLSVALNAGADTVAHQLGEKVHEKLDEGLEVVKAIGRGFTTGAENLLVHAPTALMQASENFDRRFGLISPEVQGQIDQAQANLETGWNRPLLEMTETAQRFFAPAESQPSDFFEHLRKNPRRALEVGLAENVPQLLITLAASAIHPAAGIAVAGASEGGGAYKEAKDAGASDEEAATAAGLTALPNMVLEYLPAGRLLKKVFHGVPQQELSGMLRGLFTQAMHEGSTEVLQEVNSVLAGLATYAGDRGFTWNDFRSLFSPENLKRYGASGLIGSLLGAGSDLALGASHGGPEGHGEPHGEPPTASSADPTSEPSPSGPETGSTSEAPPAVGGARIVPFPLALRAEESGGTRAAPVEPPTAEEPVAEPAAPREVPRPPEPSPGPPPAEPPVRFAEPIPEDEPPTPAPPPPEAPPFVVGRSGTTFTERGRPIEFDYALVEAGQVRTSHTDALDPEAGYPPELQPRDRDRAASALQISRIEQHLNPALVGENPKASDGAPILGPDGLVEGGNARTIGIRRAYRSGSERAHEYRSWLRDNAHGFGLDPAAVDALAEPLLVRVRRSEVGDLAGRAELARELNESGVASMSATERAQADAARISPEMLDSLHIPESGEVNWQANRPFVEGFLSRLSPAEQGALFDKQGRLSLEGQQRLRNAVLARAFGDSDAVAKLVESTDNNVRTLGSALLREAPRFAALRAAIEQGALHPRDLSSDVTAALRKLSALRAEGSKVEDYLAQGEMFGAELSPEARELLSVFDRHARSGRAIGDVLRAYAGLVEALGHPQQASLFGASEPPSKLELLRTAAAETEFDRQRDLFGGREGRASAAGRGYLEADPHVGSHTPEATKLWRRLAVLAHPDRAVDEADRARRTKFLVEANNAYEFEDLARLQQILNAWQAGEDIDVRPTGRKGPAPPRPGAPGSTSPSRSAPPPPPSKVNEARRSVDTEPAKLRLELPEIVELVQDLGRGELPRVLRVLRVHDALGLFLRRRGDSTSGEVHLRADIAQDPDLAAKVLAHEAGHWVDFLPDGVATRGNILGRLASLKKYLKTMLDELPSQPSRVFTDDERAAWRRAAVRKARAELGPGSPNVAARAREIYLGQLREEMEARRLVDRGTVTDELRRLSTIWRGEFGDQHAYRDHPSELYADAFSVLLNDPDLIKREAPTFHSLFFNYLSRKPEVRSIYEEIQVRLDQGPDAVLDHRAKRYLDMIAEGARARGEQLGRAARNPGVTLGQAIVDGLIDRKSALYRKVREARRAGAAIDPRRNPIYWVEEASYHSSEAAWYLDRMNTDVLRLTRGAGVTDTELGALLGLTRAAGERAALFNPLGVQGDSAGQLREHLLAKLGSEKAKAVQDAASAWWNLRREVLAQVERSGAFSDGMIRKARENPEYVKFFVASFMQRDDAAGRATGNLHAQIGTLQKIGNPVVETALTDLALLRVAHRTQTAKSIVSFYRENFPQDIQEAQRGRGGQILETRERGRGTLYFLDHGTTRAVYASERVVSFMEADTAKAGAAYRAYNLVTRPLRALFVDRNPWWAVWNLYKDSKAFAKQVVVSGSPGDSRLRRAAHATASPLTASLETFRYLIKSLPDATQDVFFGRRTETMREMLRGRMLVESGSVSSGLAGDDAEVMDLILKRFGVIDAAHHQAGVRVLEKLWDWAGRPGQLTERLVKTAGYRYLRANQERLGLSDKEVAHRVRTLAGTPDVMRRGEWFKLTNSVFLFSNVGKEGFRSAAEAARLAPGEYAMKTLAFDVMPKLAMIAFAAGWAGDELKDWFAKLSEYDKANYLIVPLGTTPSGKAIYTRIPHDHVGQLIGGLLWRSFSDERSVSSLFEWMDQNFPYSPASLHPVLEAGGAVREYARGKNPVDAYTGHPMIPEREFAAGGRRSHEAFLRGLWNEVGLNVLARFDTEDSAEVATFLEQALDAPLLGPALARFVKVSDRGTTENLQKIRREEERDQARRSLDLEDLIRDGLAEDPEASPASLFRVAKAAGLDPGKYSYFKQRVARLRARRSGDPYERALSFSPSKALSERIELERSKRSISRTPEP